MKTIKLIVKISGYLNEVDSKDFDLVEKSVSVDCVDSLNEHALNFLESSFIETAREALKMWDELKYDYKGVKSEI